jgi:FkbM family methyltransferase
VKILRRPRPRLSARRQAPASSPFAERQARDDRNVAVLLDEILRPTSRCVDVGAHKGEFLAPFVARAPAGRHVAFEPLPELAERLCATYPHVQVESCALGEEHGEVTFYRQVESPAWSSLAAAHRAPGGSRTESLTVPMRRLDDMVDVADVVKIDVEGAELGVLRGGRRLLGEARPIVILEHAHIHADHFGVAPEDVWDFFASLRLGVFSLDGRGPHSRHDFVRICDRARRLRYGADAETNFVARAG